MSESGLITIRFTDLVGSTELASVLGDSAADDVRRRHFADLREATEIGMTGPQGVVPRAQSMLASLRDRGLQ